MLKSVYRQYSQKSKVFLYPALGITKHYGGDLFPAQTYLGWTEKGITPGDKKLICVYNDKDFLKNESRLVKHKLFIEAVETEPYKGCPSKVYIFDFKGTKEIPGDFLPEMKDYAKRSAMWLKLNEEDRRIKSLEYSLPHNWNLFLLGRYSKLSSSLKKRVKDYYRNQSRSYTLVESYLHPDKFYHLYADILGVSIESLRAAVELTNKPCLLRKEELEVEDEKDRHETEILSLGIKSVIKVKL